MLWFTCIAKGHLSLLEIGSLSLYFMTASQSLNGCCLRAHNPKSGACLFNTMGWTKSYNMPRRLQYTPSKRFNATKVSSIQQRLESIMKSAGKGHGLARDILAKEYAARDLAIRVKYSKLRGKGELGKKLDSLIDLTTTASGCVMNAMISTAAGQAADQNTSGLLDFTARVTSVTDYFIAFDAYAVRDLQDISDRRKNPPS